MKSLNSDQVKEISAKAKELVKNVDAEFRHAAFSVIFSKLIDSNAIVSQGNNPKPKSLGPRKEERSDRKGPKHQLENLIDDNFFQKPKPLRAILEELRIRTFHYKRTDLTLPLQTLVREKKLRREKRKEGNRNVFHWVNW